MITTSDEADVWFGYNEDRLIQDFDEETYINFKTTTYDTLGYMEVTAVSPTVFSIRCGVNEAGVAISGNGLSFYATNPHPERLYSCDYDSLYRIILEKSHDVSDAIDIVNNFDFGSSVGFQIHVSDASGDAFVAGPCSDGEMVITRKTGDFFISTNTNIAEIAEGADDLRTDMAVVMLERRLDKESLKATLQSVLADGYEVCTFYSTIFDLSNGDIYFYLMHDFSTEYSLNLADELKQGDHSYMLKDLFQGGEQTLISAEAGMHMQETIFNAMRLIGVGIVLVILRNLFVSSRKVWGSELTSGLKYRSILVSVIWALYWSLITLITVQLIPLLLLTSFLAKVIQTHLVSRTVLLTITFWATGFPIAAYKLGRRGDNP